VLDTSGSMEGEAIASTRAAAQALIDRMADGDRVSIVVFSSIGEVLVKSTRLDGKSRKQIAEKISKLEARGTTDLASGWGLAIGQLTAGRTDKTLNRLVLVTDGIPNDVSMIPSLIQQTRGIQVPITTLCLDVECEATLLGDIAMQTGGTYKYLDDATEVAAIFDSEVLRMHTLVARNVRLTLKPGPGVVLDPSLIGDYTAGGGRTMMLGDLAGDEERELVIPVTIPKGRAGATIEVVDAFLDFEDVVNHSGARQRHGYVGVKTSTDPKAVEAAIELDIDAAMHRAQATMATLHAIQLGRNGQLADANEVLRRGVAAARARMTNVPDAELKKQTDQMVELEQQLPSLFVQAADLDGHNGQLYASPAAAAPEAYPLANEPAAKMPADAGGGVTGRFGGKTEEENMKDARDAVQARSMDVDNRAIRGLHDESVNTLMGH
jgi:uncharacterized protein YegL